MHSLTVAKLRIKGSSGSTHLEDAKGSVEIDVVVHRATSSIVVNVADLVIDERVVACVVRPQSRDVRRVEIPGAFVGRDQDRRGDGDDADEHGRCARRLSAQGR